MVNKVKIKISKVPNLVLSLITLASNQLSAGSSFQIGGKSYFEHIIKSLFANDQMYDVHNSNWASRPWIQLSNTQNFRKQSLDLTVYSNWFFQDWILRSFLPRYQDSKSETKIIRIYVDILS